MRRSFDLHKSYPPVERMVCLRPIRVYNDPSSGSDIGSTLAMSTLSIIPATIIFLIFQKSLVDGIASTGIKG